MLSLITVQMQTKADSNAKFIPLIQENMGEKFTKIIFIYFLASLNPVLS